MAPTFQANLKYENNRGIGKYPRSISEISPVCAGYAPVLCSKIKSGGAQNERRPPFRTAV
jgi:hypothetical protein